MVVLFVLIVSYFFLVTATLTAMANDPIVRGLSMGVNNTFVIDRDSTDVNVSGLPQNPASAGGFLNMAARMFLFRFPDGLLPVWLDPILKFFNWLLIILLGIAVYRIAVPTSGG